MKKGIKIASTGSTYIASGTPDSNFSSSSSLLVGNLSSCCPAANEYRSIISFDLTNFSYPIKMAVLYLYVENIQSTTDCNLSISISNNTTTVDTDTVTWNTAPAVDYYSTLNYKLLTSDIGCYIKLDVTPIVRCWQCTTGVKSITLSSNSIINRAPLITIASTNSCNPPVLAITPVKCCNPDPCCNGYNPFPCSFPPCCPCPTGTTNPSGACTPANFDPALAAFYSAGQVIRYNNQLYLVNANNPQGIPGTSADFTLLSSTGTTGPQGPTGATGTQCPTGPQGPTGVTGTVSSAYGTFTSTGGSTPLSTTAAPIILTTTNVASNMSLNPTTGTVTLSEPGTYKITYVVVPSATVPVVTVGLSYNDSTTPSAASTSTINTSTNPNVPIVGQELYTTTTAGATVRIIATGADPGSLDYSNANLSIIKVSN